MPANRSEVKTALNSGVVPGVGPGIGGGANDSKRGELPRTTNEQSPRYKMLDRFDRYIESRQYDKLRPWNQDRDPGSGQYIPIRQRKPLVVFNLSRLFIERASAKIAGHRAFPKLTISEDPATEELVKLIVKQSKLKVKAINICEQMLKHGSVFVKFMLINGVFKLDIYNAKWCSPQFDENTGELSGVRIQYQFEDEEESDKGKKRKMKWYRLDVTTNGEILYDNPEVKDHEENEPVFQIVNEVVHNLGFVTGEWITNGEEHNKIDGESILTDMLDLSDCINYQLSQSDQAITYSQEPQLALNGMDTDEIDNLIRSSTKAWNLGKEGKAEFIEISGKGVETAADHVGRISQRAQDMAKVVILDPEKMTGIYQSGEAMKVLHGPLVDLVEEVRPWFGDYGIVPLLQKMTAAAVLLVSRGEKLAITFPENYSVTSLEIELLWKPVFPPTLDDIQKAVGIATQASTANIITRLTGTKFVAEYFGVEDPEAEQAEVVKQPLPPSPFGPFTI